MTSFPIDPEIRLRHASAPVLRSIAEATGLAREMAAAYPDTAWPDMLRRLERVHTEDDAMEAAVAVEGLLERENMLILEPESPFVTIAAPRPEDRYSTAARAVSMLYGSALAERAR